MKKTLLTTLTVAAMLVGLSTAAHAQMLTINEVYGGGGNANAPYTNDFIELYNSGTTAINLGNYSLYYASATGAFNTASATLTTTLTGTIAPGSYYLVQEGGGTNGSALPTPNQTGVIQLSGTAGKVALAITGSTITAANSTGVIDFVGYGTTASFFEGSGPAPAPSNTTSVSRVPGVDTNNNAADFTAGAPSPTAGAVPEPATYAYVAAGCGLLALVTRRRRVA